MEGTPRNDCLVNLDNEKIVSIKNKIGIDAQESILLYAPTLRCADADEKKASKTEFDIKQTINHLSDITGKKWICLLRAHPAMQHFAEAEQASDIIDVSGYEDMADLLLISDMLVTDYSSCAGDFALLNRPLVLFQGNINEYMETERELYFEMSDSPYFVAQSQEEIIDIIDSLDDDRVKDNCKQILDFYKTYESGKASYTVAKRILNWINR